MALIYSSSVRLSRAGDVNLLRDGQELNPPKPSRPTSYD